MNKIWYDVTSILKWNRPAVGVIRVQAECAKYALGLGSKIAFCRYEREIGYIPVDLEDVRKTIERLDDIELGSSKPLDISKPGRAPLIRRIATITRRVLSFMPKSLSNRVLHYLYHRREAAEASINGLREFRRALHAWRDPVRLGAIAAPEIRRSLETSPFSKGDVHISLGLDWDQKNNRFIAEEKKLKQFKTIFCCYDVIPVKFPHLCVGDVAANFAHYFVDLAWCADEFVCISECSKRDLLALLGELGAPCPETTVIKLGSHISQSNGVEVSKEIKQAVGERFILFVSTIERRKNHETLYRAYTRLLDRGVTNLPKLVFVGMPGWGVNDFLADLRFDGRVKGLVQVLTNVSDADLNWLYKNTLFTVFPSLYEGWGLAVAESLSVGKFCLASNAASIPEVGGDLIEYLDPWDVPKWAERLKWYFDNPKALADAENRIRKTYDAPTWEETAVTIFDRAEELLARNN